MAGANISLTCDIVAPWRYGESIIHEDLRLENGLFHPPDRLGLGVTPNWDTIDRWRVRE